MYGILALDRFFSLFSNEAKALPSESFETLSLFETQMLCQILIADVYVL